MKAAELEKLIEEKFDQVVVAIRASHPSAQDIKDLSKKLDDHIETHEKDNKAINEKLDPMFAAFSTVGRIRGAIMWTSATIISIWGGIEAFKKLTGK